MTEIPRPSWYKGKRVNPRVGIAISNIGAMSPAFVGSLFALVKDATFNGIVVDVYIDQNKPLDDSRNMTVKVLREFDPDYIFFVDADMMFPEDIITALISQDRDIITGVYCQKQPIYYPVLRMYDKEERCYQSVKTYPRGKLFTIDACGAGALMVKTGVFKKLKKPYFRWDFEKGISEDIYFCEKARKAGYEIWVDGRVECGHMADMKPIIVQDFWNAYDLDTSQVKKCELNWEEPK